MGLYINRLINVEEEKEAYKAQSKSAEESNLRTQHARRERGEGEDWQGSRTTASSKRGQISVSRARVPNPYVASSRELVDLEL